jgi:acyl-coenzyme A synthetase/AMP-(fatty) acid ligase
VSHAGPTLSRLLASERPGGARVAWASAYAGADREVCWGEFRGRVAALSRAISALPRGNVALYTADAYAMALGLFAIWHAGRVAVCPPNGQPGTLEALADQVIASVSDGPGAVPGRPRLSPEAPPAPGAPAPIRAAFSPDAPGAFAALSPDAVVVELFTSGTTGRGKAVPKTLAHLEREVQNLEAVLGARIGDAPVLGSASHQHLYGMLFRVLWPLAAGRPFHGRAFLHAEEIRTRLRSHGPCALASVPAHLKRVAESEGMGELARGCRVVFSSGGPLAAETAERWEQASGSAPVEIFGSTETGGVAWRQQGCGRAGTPWTPFPGVRVARDAADARLRVHSPIASVGDEASGFAMGDRVRLLPDGRFEVEGRADRVLKIGEKRLSLPDMEERLLEHAFVEAVALLSLSRRGELRVAAAVVLAPEGREALAAQGARRLRLALSDTLAREWDRVLLPRVWRFVEALPEDPQGKVTLGSLRALFPESAETVAAPDGDGA